MSGISVEVLPDASPPQVGVAVGGLPTDTASTVTVEWSTDGATWSPVRGVVDESVTGSGFWRDHVPPLNVATTYRLVTDAELDPAITYAWTGTPDASTSTQSVGGVVARTNLSTDPAATTSTTAATWAGATGTSGVVTQEVVTGATDGPAGGPTSYRRVAWTTAATSGSAGVYHEQRITGVVSDVTSMSFWVRSSRTMTATLYTRFYMGSTVAGQTSQSVTIPAGQWVRVGDTATATAAYDRVRLWLVPASTSLPQAGDVLEVTGALIEATASAGQFFYGSTPSVLVTTTATITVPSDVAWLQDPLQPRTAVPVACVRSGDGVILLSPSAGELSRQMPADVVRVQGARLPVASLGVRQAPSGIALHLRALAAAQGALITALSELIETAGTVVLRGLPADIPLDPVAHIIAPEVTDSPVVGGLLGPRRDWQMSVTQVRPPSPRISVPWWTYDQVRALWAGLTYDEVRAARPGATYLDWLRDPSPGASVTGVS